jgi:CheY-like chemotaxis protein
VEKIVQAARRARDLVRQLLAFSRKQVLELEPVDLNKILTEFEKLLRRTIREDVAVEIIPAPSLPPVKADVGQLEQVIMNLAVNAQDAMPDGGRLTIQTGLAKLDQAYAASHEEVTPGPHVMLCVSDTGCGMDACTSEQIFEPFFTTKAEQGGTGLGLATVYGIVKQHGGHIWVYSEPGQGATFRVYLPVSEVSTRPEKSRTIEGPTDRRGFETVLVVEDNRYVRRIAHTILERQGYSVLVAENGQEALSILEGHTGPLHLLFTDVVMPEMNGRALFDRITSRFPGIKVLYMSGYTNEVIAQRGVLDEGINFIQKPFSVQALVDKVRTVLDED